MAASARCKHPGGRLETARLVLRPPRDDDLKELCRLYGDPAVGGHLKFGVLSPMQTAELLSDYLQMWIESGFGNRIIVEQASDGFVGEVGLRLHDRTGEPAMRYALRPDFQGRGYGREAVQATLGDAFSCIGIARVDAFTRESNNPSCRLLDDLGGRISEIIPLEGDELRKYSFFLDQWTDSR